MKKRLFVWILTSSTAAAAALPLGSAPAVAQQTEKKPEEIVVEAPRVVRRVVGRTAEGVGQVEEITLTRRVDYADLDLTQYKDVTELDKRIDDIAKEACDQLAQLYPLADTDTRDCVEKAVADAKPQVDEAIAAAENRR